MGTGSWYALGQKFRTLLAGRDSGLAAGADPGSAPYPLDGRTGVGAAGVVGQFNQAARLKPGHLLVVYLGLNACYQVNPETGQIEYLFTVSHEQAPFLWRVVADRSGRVYATLSGAKNPRVPTRDAVFGLAGAVVEVNHRLGTIRAIATGTSIVDPDSIQVIDQARLLVCDFNGFGQSGSIYTVDRHTGEIKPRASGGLLKDPVSAIQDKDGVLWVANAYMHYEYGVHNNVFEKDDGEILRIDPDGKQTVIVPRQSPAGGSMVGIHPANDEEHVIAVRGDWPMMQTGAVLRVNKKNHQVETLLTATPTDPRFYSTHVDLAGDVLWVGESYHKQLVGYDLEKKAVVKTVDFSPVMGGAFLGVASSFEGIESVSVVPRDLEG